MMTTKSQSAPKVDDKPKPSPVEGIKDASRQLRGAIAETLAGDADHFEEAEKQLLKFHGTYQQEDRDARKSRAKAGLGKHYMFMVRCRIPGGRLTADQYLAMDRLADSHANGTLRLTTRQSIQFHGVLKSSLKGTIAGINECLLSTLGACGDVERNVMACPAPHHDGVHAQLQQTASDLAVHLAPRTTAYHEIWLNGKKIDNSTNGNGNDVEPLYGKVYLPRKFKTGLALPEDNCIDIYAQDLGLLAIVDETGQIAGYNVLVGGGMGMTHGKPETFPHLARPICYVPAGAVLNAAEAVVRLFRDHGNRGNRKRARIKYLVHDWGVEKFREVLTGYLGATPALPKPVKASQFDPHLGWQAQGDGKFFYGLSIENGRIKDEGGFRLRSALRTIVERFQPEIRLTAIQDILICNLNESARASIDKILAEHGVKRPDQVAKIRQYSMACPAIPTCGLAITESERSLPGLIDELEAELRELGLQDETIAVRMTGCPNGCARPYQSDIGLVGRSGDKYMVYVGGNHVGDELSFVLRDLVPIGQVVPTLRPLLTRFKKEKQKDEVFGRWCQRIGKDELEKMLPPPDKQSYASRLAKASSPETMTPAAKNGANGASAHHASEGTAQPGLAAPDTQRIGLDLAPPHVAAVSSQPEAETFLVGHAGEERRDYTIHFSSDGSVHSTIVYFYGKDARASSAGSHDALCREATYQGRVHPYRLHASRKLSDTVYVGEPGRERAERRVEYHSDGSIARTVLFTYDEDRPAQQAPSAAPLRRETTFPGKI